MHGRHLRALAFCLAVTGIAVPVSAQSVPKAELSGGYQFLNFASDGENESMAKGWYFDLAGNLTPAVGIVFQVGGNYKSYEESVTIAGITATATADLRVHEFMGGLRVNARSNAALVPYGQVLVGGINGSANVSVSTTIPGAPPIGFDQDESGTNFGLEIGGGMNVGFAEAFGLRFGVDYLRVFEEDAGGNLFRFHAGIVIGR